MKIVNDSATLEKFPAWSGAIQTKEQIIEAGKAEAFESMIEELYPDGLTDTALNDLLWFESDWIFESLGMTSEEDEPEEDEE